MPFFVFKIEPSGREVRINAPTEDAAHRRAWDSLSHAERDGCSGIECIDVEPLACSPVGPVIDPFEDLPALKMDDEQGADHG